MNNLLRVNEGLSSRFADEITFPSLSPEHCLQLLQKDLKQSNIAFPSIQDPITYKSLLEPISEMSKLRSWGNARDIKTLAKSMVRAVYEKNTTKVSQLSLPSEIALEQIQIMLAERRTRSKSQAPSSRPSFSRPFQTQDNLPSAPPTGTNSSTSTTTKTEPHEEQKDDKNSKTPKTLDLSDEGRDLGVSDDIWQQLQKDIREIQLEEQRVAKEIEDQIEAQRLADIAEKEAEEAAAALKAIQAKNEAEALALARRREEARLREMKAKAERERIQRELEQRKRIEEERREKEELAQRRLRQMGVCVQGYRWIDQGNGYRCAGGSHFVSYSQLGV